MRQFGPVRLRRKSALLLLLIGLMLAGCTSSRPGAFRAQADDSGPFTVAGVDAGAGGLKMTVAELLPAKGNGRLQAYGTSNVQVQTYVSLADAVWQWERKGAPQLVVIGEEWIRLHGFSSTLAKQIGRLGLKEGRRPLMAVTEGTAEEVVRKGQAARSSAALLQSADWTANPLHARTVSYEDDLVLPYLTVQRDPGAVGSAQAVLFKKGQLVGTLTPQQSGLLSCLRGTTSLPELAWSMHSTEDGGYKLARVSCRSKVRGNGSLSHPLLVIDVAVQGSSIEPSLTPGEQTESAIRALEASFAGLVRYLQEHRIDPLHAGDSFREQYAGIWSPDRWRTAFAGADVKLRVGLNFIGGANP